ncbi:membrane protein [Vibrio sp. MACH09]|uniref:DedA family protein n=1 Tax=unclassified Vibrio TaxID=2614977 RepID=UPI0014939B05|nr:MULTISPECIES: VTT domain-containing protein [unclassified Vibrio]NOI64994.1 DedA family protein [Vibrio sp. 99-8-1]GLO62600.1 membrane protein [Vibrio sp. MACH09]
MTDWINISSSLQQSLGVSGLFISIILLSYLLEDLAIITAALLAADQSITPSLALLAIFIGIASGDIGLYGLGMLAARWRALRYRLLTNKAMRTVRQRLKKHTMLNIAFIRFIPGLRTIGFTLSGLFRVNFIQFMTSVILATALWTAIVFFAIYQLGSIEWLENNQWKWIIAPCALFALWKINRRSSKKIFSNSGKGVST